MDPQEFLERHNTGKRNFRDVTLVGPNLRRANLEGVSLEEANLHSTYLSDAILTGANLGLANLEGAILSRAELTGALFLGTNLQWADLRGAKQTGANLDQAFLRVGPFTIKTPNGPKTSTQPKLELSRRTDLMPDQNSELLRKIKLVLHAAYAHHGTLTAEAMILRLVLDAERGEQPRRRSRCGSGCSSDCWGRSEGVGWANIIQYTLFYLRVSNV